ncbi:MAG: asparagine synthase C-terminal domain-containing protein [Methanotrichaceae archaeon]
MVSIDIKGWIELEGKLIREDDLRNIIAENPDAISRFSGEFLLKWDGCKARDHFGIMPGDCPAGSVVCGDSEIGKIDPKYPLMDLGEAIKIAVKLRSDEGVVALSGGVDSALVAKLAGRECIAVGIEGSHDLRHAQEVANELKLQLETAVIDPKSVEDALAHVLPVIPMTDPVNASIATTLYFVAEWAGHNGYRRILAGQGADELFGGYARYLQSDNLAMDLERDFRSLSVQLARDQAVAALHDAYFSLPYMDIRVVQAAKAIPPDETVRDGIRKRPLRNVAERYLPPSIANYEKKAMQYGSGVMKVIQRLANQKGYRNSIQDYLNRLC